MYGVILSFMGCSVVSSCPFVPAIVSLNKSILLSVFLPLKICTLKLN
jgi:hypothetical protein